MSQPITAEHTHIQTEPGSYYTLGSETPKLRVIFMHGAGNNAANLRVSAKELVKLLPDAQIIVPNGIHKVPEDKMLEEQRVSLSGMAGYRWFGDEVTEDKQNNFFQRHLPDIEKQDSKKPPLFLLGFSEGGFYSSYLYSQDPDRYKGVVLHSSAIITSMNSIKPNKNPDKSAPAKLYSFIGLSDPYLRMKMTPVLLGMHFKNSVVMNWRGHKARTGFKWGLAHEITQDSLKMAAGHIQKIMDYKPNIA